jgi:hypothetical protein
MGKQTATLAKHKLYQHLLMTLLNISKRLCALWLAFACLVPRVAFGAEKVRTDINPALLYYQAFALYPELPEEERQHLFVTEWRNRQLDARFDKLIAKYDNPFKLLRHAALARVPCDWGVDLSEGPEALLPGLAKAKLAAQAARLRVLWHLKNNRQTSAVDELLASFTLGRNSSRDGVLISALVQFAIENILMSVVAENFYEFSPDSLQKLMAGFDAAPARGSIQACMSVEMTSFRDWFVAKLREFQRETPGDDNAVIGKARALLGRTLSETEQPDFSAADRLIAAVNGTSAGLLARLQELDQVYADASALLGLPFAPYQAAVPAFEERLASSTNPFVKPFFPAVTKSRGKEFAVMTKLEMVRAAIAYRLGGEPAFAKVQNPCSSGAFQLERFFFEDVDRGIMLRSNVRWTGYEEVLIFVEKPGVPFQVHGKNAGQPLPKEASGK